MEITVIEREGGEWWVEHGPGIPLGTQPVTTYADLVRRVGEWVVGQSVEAPVTVTYYRRYPEDDEE